MKLHCQQFQLNEVLASSLSLAVILLTSGCDQHQAHNMSMNFDEAIKHYRNSPVGDSVEPITRALATNWVYVGTETLTPTADGKIVGKMQLKVSEDNQGGMWACAYTSREEFNRAFPEGGSFAEMAFSDIFGIVDADQQFAGLHLNSASDSQYPIPRELFERIRPLLKQRDKK